jgi:hypothetical protein
MAAVWAAWGKLSRRQQILVAGGAGVSAALLVALVCGVAFECLGREEHFQPQPPLWTAGAPNSAPITSQPPAATMDQRFVGHWVWESYAAPIVAGDSVLDVSAHRYITIEPGGRFTDATDSAAAGEDRVSSTSGVSQGAAQGHVSQQGANLLTFQYDDGRVWTPTASLEGSDGLRLAGLLYIRN